MGDFKNVDKLKMLLGFATKARKVVFGLDAILQKGNKILTVLYDSSLSLNSLDKAKRFCDNFDVRCIHYMDLIKDAVHKQNCKIVGIIDKTFADSISKYV